MRHFILGKTSAFHVQVFRYLFVGATSAVVDLATYAFFTRVFDLHYLVAAFFGYMFGLAWNYVFSLLWVFESRHSRAKEVFMVFFIALGGLFWTELLLYVFVDIFSMNDLIGKIATLWIVLVWNFGMRKMYVFH